VAVSTLELSRSVRLRNPAGLHARPCHAIVTTANKFQSELRVACDGNEVNGKSILELMTLCAPVEATLVFNARGSDAATLVESLVKLVEDGFGEM
jgi:phosphotransferase system HPr (HPr) family protein